MWDSPLSSVANLRDGRVLNDLLREPTERNATLVTQTE